MKHLFLLWFAKPLYGLSPNILNGKTTEFRMSTIDSPSDSLTSGKDWNPKSWMKMEAKKTQSNEDRELLQESVKKIERCSPLVFAGEVRTLHENLARASQGQGFLLVGSNCPKDFNVDIIRDTFRVILQMALVLTFGSAMPVIKMGRMGGEIAKMNIAREDAWTKEDSADAELFQGFNMLEEYNRSAQTLNILRAFSTGGYADISRLHAWNLDFVEQTDEGSRYRKFATKVDESLRFMKACGVDTSSSAFTKTDFFTANECLYLPYDGALTRQDSTTDRWYDFSAHMPWICEDTRQLDGAHIEFCRGLENPIGVRISDKCTPDELIRIIDVLNPSNIPGRITAVVCMGTEKIRKNLPGLIRAVQREGKSVLWISDPVYSVTSMKKKGYDTNDFEKIREELRAFFDCHDEMRSHPGGVHLSLTGENIKECTGGLSGVTEEALTGNNQHPRLNAKQALELAFLIGERMRLRTGLPPIE